jgi:hypothetical protein
MRPVHPLHSPLFDFLLSSLNTPPKNKRKKDKEIVTKEKQINHA